MGRVVIRETEAFAFRPHVSTRARHYAAVFLNQIQLAHGGAGPMLARQLIDLYFALFKVLRIVQHIQRVRHGAPFLGRISCQ